MHLSLRAALIVFAGFLLVTGYIALSTAFSFRFEEVPGNTNYDMLAEAFLAKRLHLKQEVDPGRLHSGDPLDPSTPYPYQFDAIIWQGKYYFLQEPLPGLVHAVWIRLTGLPCPTGAMVTVFSAGAVFLLAALLWIVRTQYFPGSPPWIFWYTWASFAVSGIQTFVLSRPGIYQEAITMGSFFVLAGFIFAFEGVHGRRRPHSFLLISGISFGAAGCCRVPLFLYPMFLAVFWVISAAVRKESLAGILSRTLCFGFPIALFLVGLLTYNHLRFGDFLDFGRAHVMFPAYDDYLYVGKGGNFFRWQHVPYQLYHYLVSLPWYRDTPPYLIFPYEGVWYGDVRVIREWACSMFVTAPVLLLVLPAPFVFRYRKQQPAIPLLLGVFGGCALVFFMFLTCYYAAVLRYLYDFVPLLCVVIFVNLTVLWTAFQARPTTKRIMIAAVALIFLANLFMGIFLATVGVYPRMLVAGA